MTVRVLVCVKRVPAPGAKINITADGTAVDTAFLGFAVSPHEECAVEEAIRLVEQHGGESTVLTLGPAEAEEQLRDAVSRGANRIVLLDTALDPELSHSEVNPVDTASRLTRAIQAIEAEEGPFDLILFGNESADSGGFQVGTRVAVALDRPMVNGAKGLEVDPESASVTVRREFDAGSEVYRFALPAVVGVKEGINLPRYPTMRGRVASRKATLEAGDLSPQGDDGAGVGRQQLVELRQPPEVAPNLVVLGHGPEAAGRVVDLLEELGVLS
jgi:electron transfer flavoprotein beta subunit